MIQLGPGTLYKHGEGEVPRLCPVCGSKSGRVGISVDHPGYRGWLCYDCGYFPGKDPRRCRLGKIIGKMGVEKAEAGFRPYNN
jgi:hypothetical protein